MACTCRSRAHALVAATGIDIPELLQPTWHAVIDDSGTNSRDTLLCSTKRV
jgi:hypothetical protein